MEYHAIRDRDFFYSAVMLNTDITFKTLYDLSFHKAISSYRDIYDLDLLKSIANGDFTLNASTVIKVKKLIDSYSDIKKISINYKNIVSKLFPVRIITIHITGVCRAACRRCSISAVIMTFWKG